MDLTHTHRENSWMQYLCAQVAGGQGVGVHDFPPFPKKGFYISFLHPWRSSNQSRCYISFIQSVSLYNESCPRKLDPPIHTILKIDNIIFVNERNNSGLFYSQINNTVNLFYIQTAKKTDKQ